jgi:hypothetical protein
MKKYLTIAGIGIVILVSAFFAWQYFVQTPNIPSQHNVIQDTKNEAKIVNYETEDNLKSFQLIKGCVKLSEVSSQHTPADIFPSIADCLKEKKYEDAVGLYGLAIAYGNFDMKRVSDITAHQAISALTFNYLNTIPEDIILEFNKVKKPIIDSKKLCDKFVEIGHPKYYPTYMIAHGMGSFMENNSDSDLKKDFDAEAVWDEILKTSLHCTD